VEVKSPVRENRPPGSVRGAPGNRRPYRDPFIIIILLLTLIVWANRDTHSSSGRAAQRIYAEMLEDENGQFLPAAVGRPGDAGECARR
jgi:hypothetical protein